MQWPLQGRRHYLITVFCSWLQNAGLERVGPFAVPTLFYPPAFQKRSALLMWADQSVEIIYKTLKPSEINLVILLILKVKLFLVYKLLL